MPAKARGSIYMTKNGPGIRWVENGRRRFKSPFKTKTAARDWFDKEIVPGLHRHGPSAEITFGEFCDVYLDRWGSIVAKRTKDTENERLRPARDTFGDWTLRELEGAAADIAAWRARLTDTSRYRHTRSLRQIFGAAVRWRYIDRNPAIDAGSNPELRADELQPFTRKEIDDLVDELGPLWGAVCIVGVETGLRTNEWIAIERRDIDRVNPAVTVQRRFSAGKLTPYPKTGRRRMPLTLRALGALDAIPPRLDTRLLFPAPGGGYLNLDNWRTREWYPALAGAGVAKRGPYTLRHTFATEALAAGVSIFQLSRLMGASVKTIDRTYGHLAHDSEDHVRGLLDNRYGVEMALAAEGDDGREG